MKPSYNDLGLIKDENGNLIGVNLGWDFTAEHEWGVRGISQKLGIKGKGYGPGRFRVTDISCISTHEIKVEEGYSNRKKSKKFKTFYVIACYRHGDPKHFFPTFVNDGQEVFSAWSGDSGFVVGIADRNVYETILKAIQEKNVIVTGERMFAKESNPFSGSGLKIVIWSAIPEEWETQWIEAHKDHERLLKAAKDTGIEEKLRVAGKKWYALSPRWATLKSTTRGEFKTAYEVMFWLNPMEQRDNESGWFSVEDLEAWIVNTGPVIKVKVAK